MSESNFWGAESGAEPHIVQGPNGVDFPARPRIQFSGAVSVTDTDGKTVVAIPSGRRGDPGPAGDTGPMPTIAAEAEPLVYTSEPAVEATPTPTGVLLTFGIPQGIPGEKGERGDPGPATISIGTVTTGEPGTAASVTNTGTAQDAVLSFSIPRGEQGIQGQVGQQGEQGPPGPAGAPIWQRRA